MYYFKICIFLPLKCVWWGSIIFCLNRTIKTTISGQHTIIFRLTKYLQLLSEITNSGALSWCLIWNSKMKCPFSRFCKFIFAPIQSCRVCEVQIGCCLELRIIRCKERMKKSEGIKYNNLLRTIFGNVMFVFWCINDVRGSVIWWQVRNTIKRRYGSSQDSLKVYHVGYVSHLTTVIVVF